MKIIKEIPTFRYGDKLIDPNSRLGKFISKLNSLINNEDAFYEFISSMKYWDLPRTSLWSFEEVLNYIDDLLFKYSQDLKDNIISEKIIPLLKFIFLLLNNSISKEIFSSFDHLQTIFLKVFDTEVKAYIINIFMLFDYTKGLIYYFTDIFHASRSFVLMRNVLIHMINNNFTINSDIVNELEEILAIVNKKWKMVLAEKNSRLPPDEKKFEEVNPFRVFREIIINHKNYKNKNEFSEIIKEYEYFAESDVYEKLANIDNSKIGSMKRYLIKDESIYIIIINNFFCILNDLVQINPNNIDYPKLKIICKYILSMVNICSINNQYFEEVLVTEYYIESYLKDVLMILTSNCHIDIKCVFLNYCINFITSNPGYESILFQNGLFHSILSDLTHQNGNNLEILSIEDSNNQSFLKIVLTFLFSPSSIKDMPLYFLNNILQIPKDNIYPYRLDNVVYSLKKKKIYDENVINNYLIPRLIYELEHITVPDSEVKYSFIDNTEKKHNPTINERTILISKIFKILVKIVQKTTNINSLNNIDSVLSDKIKNLLSDEKIKTNPDYNSVILNSIYYLVKLCNYFPSKIPNYIQNGIFDLIFDYFSNYLPKENGLFYLIFLALYTISIHNKGKAFILENNRVINLTNSLFAKIQSDENYFYYDLNDLTEIYAEELYSPYAALIRVDGIKEIIKNFYVNLNNFMEKTKKNISEINIEYSDKMKPNLNMFKIEKKMKFILIFFITLNKDDIKYLEETCQIDIKSSIKLFFSFFNIPIILLCNTLVINHILLKAISELDPEAFLNEFYVNFSNLINQTNTLNIHPIQKDKIICTYQRIIESSLKKLYFECKSKNFFQNYCSIFMKFIAQRIIQRSDITTFFYPINNRALIIDSDHYIYILSNIIKPELKKFLKDSSNKYIFERELPHCSNYNLTYINEDNYLEIKYEPKFDKITKVEILGEPQFNNEILTHELRIKINILDTFNFISIMGKMIKSRALYDIQESDIEVIKNYMNLSYIICLIFKFFRKKCFKDINENSPSENIIKNLLPFTNMLSYINNILNGKINKTLSPIVLFYLIKYGGMRELFKISKKIIEVSKNESNKKELPLIEILIIKNIWNVLSSIMLYLIKYQFSTNIALYLILIREKEVSTQFTYKNEIDVYAKFLMLNDLIYVFFNNEKNEENLKCFSDIEKYGVQMYTIMLNLFDNCCLSFTNLKNILDVEDIYKMGYKVYEVMQCIQEGKDSKEKIVNYLIKIKEKEEEIKKEKEKKDQEKNKLIEKEEKGEKEINDEEMENKNDEENNNNPGENPENLMEVENDGNNNENNEGQNNNDGNNENNENEGREGSNNNERSNENENRNENNNLENNNENREDIASPNISHFSEINSPLPININQNNNNQNRLHLNNYESNFDSFLDINIRPRRRRFNFLNFDSKIESSVDMHLINHTLSKLEELPLYPNSEFISYIKNSMDEDNSIFKKSNNDKKEKNEYSLTKFSEVLKKIQNLINKGDISINKINIIRKLNIDYRIKEIDNKDDILKNIMDIQNEINNLKNEKEKNNLLLNDKEKLILELQYKMQINYSVLRYHQKNNLLQETNEKSYYEFIINNNIIKNNILSIKSLIPKENEKLQNENLVIKLIYENLLSIFICFKFLNYFKKDFENEKKLFLDMFMDLLKYESENKSSDNYILNESIIIIILMNVIDNFDDIKILIPYLNEGLFTKLINLKFNKAEANINFYENKFKFFVTINECFKQFVIKIFTEEKMFQNLLEGVFKYAWANVKNENNEIYVDDFIELCSEYAKGNEKIFEKTLLNLFDIVEIENSNSKESDKNKDKDKSNISSNKEKKAKYTFRIKPIYEKNIQNIKNELKILDNKDKEKNAEKDKNKDKEENKEIAAKNKNNSTDKVKQKSLSQGKQSKKKEDFQSRTKPKKSEEQPKTQQQILNTKKKMEEQMEQISQLFSDTNKSIFHYLLKHIWGAASKIEKDIEKNEKFKKFSRNYIIDLDTSLIALSNILYSFPSYLSLVGRFHNGKKHKVSFCNFLVRNVLPVLNYYHYCVVMPPHVNNNEELIDIFAKEKNDTLRKYGSRANSFMSFMESFRYINIIVSLVQSMTYKKRNMNEDEIFLMNKFRKKLLFELNNCLSEIMTKKMKDFNSLQNNSCTPSRSLIVFKSSLIALFAMTEFHDESHIYSQYNPFEISNLIFSKDYDIIKNISTILKNMKLNNKNEIYHEMGIKYLSNLFKFIRINSKLKINNIVQKNSKKNDSEQENEEEENIDMEDNQNEENENDEDEDIEEEDEVLSESDSFEDEDDGDNWEEIDNNSFIEDDEDEDNEEEEEENNTNANIEEPNESNLFNINEENEDEINNNENNNNNNNEENDENNNQSQNPNQNNLEDLINIFSGLSNSYVNNNIINNNNNNNSNNNNLEHNENENENDNENEQEEEDIEYDEMEEEENDNEDDEDEDSMNIVRNNNNRIEIIENESHSESNENIRRRGRPFRRRSNEIEIVQRNNYQNDDYTLFYNPSLDNNANGTLKSELELYFQESVCFPFEIYKYLELNSLILFYKTKMYVKICNKKSVEIVEKMGNLFLYNYINPFDNNYKRYFFFSLIGAKEGALSHYFKEIEKIKENFNSMCIFSDTYDKKLKTERSNIIKQIKASIVENNPNIIKIEKKEEKEKNNEDKDKKESKKDNNESLISNISIEKFIDKIKDTKSDDNKDKENDDKEDDNEQLNNNENNEVKEEKEIKIEDKEKDEEKESKEENSQKMEMEEIEKESEDKDIEEKSINEEKENENKDKDKEDKEVSNENKNEENNEIKEEQNNNENDNNKNDDNKNNENDNKEKNNENNNNNNDNANNNSQNIDNQFIVELPPDLREEILLNLDPTMVPNLSPDLQQEYHRLVDRNNFMFFGPPANLQNISNVYNASNQNDDIGFPINLQDILNLTQIKNSSSDPDKEFGVLKSNNNKLQLIKHKYKKEEILSSSKHNKEYSSIILQVFDDDFIENLFLYNIKTIISYRQKCRNINYNVYFQLLNELIMNVHLRHKILDIIFILWMCDSTCIKNISKNKNCIEKNNFIKNLHYLYTEMDLSEDHFFEDYDNFFQNFSLNYQKEMKKYFLNTAYNEKGGYISLKNKKEYLITKNCQNIKEIINIKYDKGENVLSNLLSLIMLNSKSDIKKIFSIKIFTNIVQNIFKDENSEKKDNNIIATKNNNNILHISKATIEKIIDLFNNFEISLELNKGAKSNNPTSLLNELMLDNNVFQILLEVILKKITQLKGEISKEMETFFNHKNLDITLFSKPLPEIILFKLIKFVNNINNNINKKYITKSNESKEEKELIEKNIKIKKELFTQYKAFIEKISDTLFPCWEKLNKLLNEINILLKDDQKTIASKLNLLIPYLEAFITISHLHFIFYGNNSSANNSNKFVMEKNYQAEKKSPMRNNFASFSDNTFFKFFYNFCEKNKKVINILLRRYPKKFPNDIIIKISSILDLENKKKYFRQELKKLPFKNEYLRIKVRRNGSELYTDSFGSLSHKKADHWRSKLIVTFDGEEAVDAGGVKREWLTILSKEMFNPNYMLFTLAKNNTTYTINCDSGKFNPDHLKQFEFIGKIMAKVIFDGMMLDCYFTRTIYKLITNTPLTYHDMEDYDPQFYNSLKWLLENDFTGKETYFTFSYDHDNLGDLQTIDLIENGRNIDVTEENKFDYVQKLCSSKLYETIKPQVEALLKGFYEIIPQKLISIFNYRELELVISGLPTIDIKDWKNNTEYENYNEESPIIKYFWEIIESFDNDERAEFLQFVTGCSKVPLEGFSALQGIGGINKFKISKVFEKNFDRLPTAHTCTNQLDLPEYPNKEILYERLTFAIKEGKGFGFI